MTPTPDGRLSSRLSSVLAGLVAASALAAPARAAPPRGRVAGTIVRVDANELFIDVGIDAGLHDGDTIEVFRRIEIEHPVSHKPLVDRFPIGAVTVAESGHVLSIVSEFASLEPAPRVGDLVFLAADTHIGPTGPTGPTVGALAPAAACPPPTSVTASADPVSRLFELTLGLPLSERVELWERWLHDNPDSPRIPVVRSEVDTLHALMSRTARADTAAAPASPRTLPLTARVAMPEEVMSDQPIEVYLAILEREEVVATRLLVRRVGEPTFTPIPLEADGRLGMRARLDGPWREPGALKVRIEAVRTSGAVEVVTPGGERTITIRRAERDTVGEAHRSRASARFDWMSFWTDRAEDQYVRFESDFRYRIGSGPLEAFRMGVGLFKGRGGATDALDAGADGTTRGVDYGFAEVELAVAPLFGLAGRLTVGSFQPDDHAEPLASVFGGAVEARVGELDKTRLYGGAQSTEHIGDEFWLRVAIAEVRDWPMEASVVVTNLPVGADYGVSLGYGLSWQATDLFALTLRLGWNARTINHSGFTVGTGAVLSW